MDLKQSKILSKVICDSERKETRVNLQKEIQLSREYRDISIGELRFQGNRSL